MAEPSSEQRCAVQKATEKQLWCVTEKRAWQRRETMCLTSATYYKHNAHRKSISKLQDDTQRSLTYIREKPFSYDRPVLGLAMKVNSNVIQITAHP